MGFTFHEKILNFDSVEYKINNDEIIIISKMFFKLYINNIDQVYKSDNITNYKIYDNVNVKKYGKRRLTLTFKEGESGYDTNSEVEESEDTVVEEVEDQEVEDQEVEDQEVSVHPYDLPGEWFVLNAQSGHEKKVQTNILTRIKNLHLEEKVYEVIIPTDEVVEIRNGKKVNIEKKTFPGYS